MVYFPVSHVKPFVHISLKTAGHAEAWQSRTEQVDGFG